MALLEFASPSYAVLEREQRVTVEVVRYGNTDSEIHFRYVGALICTLSIFACVLWLNISIVPPPSLPPRSVVRIKNFYLTALYMLLALLSSQLINVRIV